MSSTNRVLPSFCFIERRKDGGTFVLGGLACC